jgi:hypothetical protein
LTEISKDFLKLIASLIVVLTIFLTVLNSGILESLFALKTYAEPLTLLDHLAAAIETASSCPGECSLSVRTSGLPYILEIYKENGNYYASIDASLVEEKSNVKFLPNQQKPVFTKPLVSDCVISEQKLALTEGLIQDITIKKVFEGGTCKVFFESKKEYYDFNISVEPDTLLALNGTISTTTVTVSLVGSQIAPEPVSLTVMGAPPGVTITLDKNDDNPTFTSTMTVTADPTAAQGIYNLTIMGTSGNLARTASIQIEVSPTLYTFILNSEINIVNLPLTNVEVNLNGINKSTRSYDEFTSNIIYSMIPGSPYSVKVDDPFADPQGPRLFSHFRDFDCKGNSTGYILDTNANPYPFGIPSDWTLTYSRKMTAFYKAFTQIRNLEFDNATNTISGNLLDEDFNPISKEETSYATCNVSTTVYPNRNVDLYYLDSCTNNWQPIGSVASSFAWGRFYDKFDKDNNNWGINDGNWNIINGELNNSGIGYESIQTKWNFWNSSSDGNNNLEVSVKLLSGNNVSIRVFDAINEYYLQTNDSYNNIYLWVNGALKQNVALTGINSNQWNTWRIKQNESYMEFYLNGKKLIRYSGVPMMNFGRVMIETLNTKAAFDNVTVYDGSWSYHLDAICSMKKIRAAYISSDWYYNDTTSGIDIDPMTVPCKLMVNTQIDIPTLPLPGVEVNVTDGVTNTKYNKITTGPLATAVYFLASSFLPVHNITVNDMFSSRKFSHFWDQDCNPLNIGNWLDTANNPYWFSMCRDKNITVQYKTFTNIKDFKFVNRIISGKLLDENDSAIIKGPKNKHVLCEDSSINNKNVPVNRNVTLEYYKNGAWHYLGVNDSQNDGSWKYDWGCVCNATKLRANYTPTSVNWFYMPNSTEINIVCPCKLTVIAQIDVPGTPLKGVKVDVSGKINWTDSSGIVEYELVPGSYDIKVDNPFGVRPFSHFWDNDCDPLKIGYWLDIANNPYTFGMYDRDKNITAQYKTFTNITDFKGNQNTFEYDGKIIKGKLLDENGGAIIESSRGYHPKCEDKNTKNIVDVNRNVTIEVYNSSDGKWYLLGVVNSLADGNWSYDWIWTSGIAKIRVNYTPSNWYYVGTSTEISLLRLKVRTIRDIIFEPPVQNVQVIFDGITKSSGTTGTVEFMISKINHDLKVEDPKNTRQFSHFFDSDCDRINLNYWLDSASNPYIFTTWDRDRNINAYYKSFTNITDYVGTKNTFDYNGNRISGKLLDEDNNTVMTGPRNKHNLCENSAKNNNNVPVNRNVTLEYYDGSWYYLNATDSLSDGSWSYDWICKCNTTKIRVNYTPLTDNWFYMGTSAEKNIDPSTCPCKLTVYTFKDLFIIPISSVQVSVNGDIKTTDGSGKTEFMLTPGIHTITVDKLSNTFSHFWDKDCDKNNIGWSLDTVGLPLGTYAFNMYNRERVLTALYKLYTQIIDFNYDETKISGKLLDEQIPLKAIISGPGNYHPICEDSLTINEVPVNRNVTLEYYNGSWNYIESATATALPADGSWSYPWSCVSGATKLRVNYTPTNWYYMPNSTEIPIVCTGILDVYAFVGVNQVDAKVAIGLGDVNWDGVVNNTDLNLVQNAFGSSPGTPNWCLDCDMNIDNITDVLDLQTVSSQIGKNIAINKTHFTVDLDAGTYKLRAKYDNQIKNNLSVVINAGQTTAVNFSFLTCDGFTALNCSVPGLTHSGDFRNLTGSCGRTSAKIDCDGTYNSRTVCNTTASPGPLCSNINPSIGSYSVSSTSVNVGDSFSINVNGNCPSDLPGKCLVECRVINPDGNYTELDNWSSATSTLMPSVTCSQAGNYIVDYCVVVTDFCINRCWGSIIDTDAIVSCTSPQCSDIIDNDGDGYVDANDPGCHSDGNTANPASYDPNDNDEIDYKSTFKAQVDITGEQLSNVQVNVNGMVKSTIGGIVTYRLPNGTHTISVQSETDSRYYSHFWDSDCNQNNIGWYYDTADNPYTFNMYNRDRDITAQYKTFTQIKDFSFDSSTISGKLLDENNNPIIQQGGYHPTCTAPEVYSIIPVDRIITLEYYDGSWHQIGSPKFFDDFNDNNYNGWTGAGTWSVTGGELSDSGSGGTEYINTNWNGWNSNDYVSVNIKLSGVDVWVKIFDGSNEYYFQTWNGYTDLHLYVNGVNVKSVALAGINPNDWNIWKIKQSGSTIEVYINDQKWMDYNSAPTITNGRIQLRNSNPTKAFFDDVNVDGIIYKKDGSWSYPWYYVSVTTKLRATYNPLNWYYNYTSAEINLCDNDGVCDAGENCENCGDCPCLPGEHCCPGGFCFPIGPCPL